MEPDNVIFLVAYQCQSANMLSYIKIISGKSIKKMRDRPSTTPPFQRTNAPNAERMNRYGMAVTITPPSLPRTRKVSDMMVFE